MHGLENVGHRHDDTLSRTGRADLERLLATYYREIGWWVEHVGTGGTDAKSDGGVDLRIRRDAQIVLVHCKHWDAKHVPQNAVHELIGWMVNEGATGAILVSNGEFTSTAIEAANRHGHVKLIDRDTLRGMFGSLLEPEDASAPTLVTSTSSVVPEDSRRNLLRWSLAVICAVAFLLIIVRAILLRTADTAADDPSVVAPQSMPLPPAEAEIRDPDAKRTKR